MKQPAFFYLFCICLFALLSCYGPSQAASALKQEMPTEVDANSMVYDANKQTVVFTGSVYVKRPDFELWSDELTVYLKKAAQEKSAEEESAFAGMAAGDIDRIVALKNVRLSSGDKKGRCQKATYFADTERIVMEGAPVLTEKENSISGNVIVHNLRSNLSEVKSNVKAHFLVPDKTTGKGK